MNFKMPKSQEQSERLQNEELEAIAVEKLDTLVKNRSLRGKVAEWAAMAVSIAGISVGMAMPAQALHRVSIDSCVSSNQFLSFYQKEATSNNKFFVPTMCFAKAGDQKVLIANVLQLSSGNNAGYVFTNKGTYRFRKHQDINFLRSIAKGPVTILRIKVL